LTRSRRDTIADARDALNRALTEDAIGSPAARDAALHEAESLIEHALYEIPEGAP
jgi:hypothetical protein